MTLYQDRLFTTKNSISIIYYSGGSPKVIGNMILHSMIRVLSSKLVSVT